MTRRRARAAGDVGRSGGHELSVFARPKAYGYGEVAERTKSFTPLPHFTGSAWQGGWLSDHLWYLRAYFWMVLLAPLLAALARRLVVALPVFTAAIGLLELAGRRHLPLIGAGTLRVLLGDAVTYGLFVVLGMAYARRRRTLRRSPGAGAASTRPSP